MCDCGDSTMTGDVMYEGNTVIARNVSTCSGITVDLLEMWKRKLDCLIQSGQFEDAETTQEIANNTQLILNNYIQAKLLDPTTCEYFEYVPLLQSLIARIVIAGICK